MVLFYKFFFPVSTKGNLVPFKQGYDRMVYKEKKAH